MSTDKVLPWILAKKGGKWLRASRDYLLWHVKDGDSCRWGSDDQLTMTVRQIEEMASEIAAAAINEYKEQNDDENHI